MSAKKRKTVFALGALACMVMGMLFGCKSASTPQSIMTALPTASTTAPAPTRILSPTSYPGPIYYVDCSASTNGDGSQDSPWNTLATVNATTFAPGDQILLMRGTVCVGQMWPKGSGADGNPIMISAYGTGARPVIDGNYAVAPVVTIKDQDYWVFDSLEVRNSTGLGFYIDGSLGADLHGFTLTSLYVHDGGLSDGQHLILIGQYKNHSVHDVLIENVEASFGWRGIEIGGKCCNDPEIRSTNIIIRNAIVHDVQSDGILVASTNNALAEYSVVYNSGIMTELQNHTPNGLWTWDCDDCTVQFNEVYESHSPSVDGGAFDIDYFDHRNIVQYNYAHDNDNYCVAVFGGNANDVTLDNIVRYNICSNDVRDGSQGAGAIVIFIWAGGGIRNTFIYNNTIYYNPANTAPAISMGSRGDMGIVNTNIVNNIIYSTSPNMVRVFSPSNQLYLDHNLYWYLGPGAPNFSLNGITYTSFGAWQTGSGQDMHSLYTDPLLNDPTYHGIGFPTKSFTLQTGSPAINAGVNLEKLGLQTSMDTHDFFGNLIPVGEYDIGAYEYPYISLTPTADGKLATKTPIPLPQTSTPIVHTPTPTPATSYYVDCSLVTNGTGTQASPWNNLDTVNALTFMAGEQILFQRGTTCVGQLWPKGSGMSGNPITISAYGTGARPIIDGNNAVAPVVTIKDQNYWTFDSLEIKNSTGKGLYVDGTIGADLYGFTLTNLYVHHMGFNNDDYAVLVGQYNSHSVHDVLIDNVVTHTAFRGIGSGGKCCNNPASRSTNFIIRNSTVYDMQSDGILIASVNNGLVEHSVVYNTGIMPTLINHNPNGLWTWDCDDCTVQFNEVYESHSPKKDGGAYDIDFYNHLNIVQYNYGHDNDAYCVAVFGAGSDDVTTNSIIRYNICSNDGRNGGSYPGIYLTAKKGGTVWDTYIYNNTVYWNPASMTNQYAIYITSMDGGQAINNTNIYNNLIYSTTPNLVSIEADAAQQNLDYNLYWYTGADSPKFKQGTLNYNSLSDWQAGTGKDMHSIYADPQLNDPTYHEIGFPTTSHILQEGSPAINAGADLVALGIVTSMGTQDFFGNPLPVGAYDIGAYEHP